jgi:hypothetical protein
MLTIWLAQNCAGLSTAVVLGLAVAIALSSLALAGSLLIARRIRAIGEAAEAERRRRENQEL